MFDGLFKPKFYTKCKSLVRITKTRVETVKRKKNAVCKYLKNDIADLLNNKLDYNAFGRAEGLIQEKRRLSCYEFLEQFCSCVATNVSLIQKSSGCPGECREAISSLVYAAARVSEVPELRDLRSLFADRYGNNSLEQFVNQQFVERFITEPPSKETKLQLLQEIAREYSIKWEPKSLEQKLYTPPPTPHTEIETTKEEKNREGVWRSLEEKNKSRHTHSEDESSTSTSESSGGGFSSSTRSLGTEEDPELKPFYYRFMPDPYNKPHIEKQESLPEKITKYDLIADETDSPKPKPRSVRRRFAKPPPQGEDEDEDEDERRKGISSPRVEGDSLYPLKLPPSIKSMRSDSMEKTGGEGIRKMSRRTASWQLKASNEYEGRHFELPDFEEVAARMEALRQK